MEIKCNTHKEDYLNYLPRMSWFCKKCEKEKGNVTLSGYAPENTVPPSDKPTDKAEVLSKAAENLSAQDIADLLVRRVYKNTPDEITAHVRYERTVCSVSDMLNIAYSKIDNGVSRENDQSLMGILYDKGFADYMQGKGHQHSLDDVLDMSKDQLEAYQNGWEEALEEVEYGKK